jgi:threonylcarbamoyladenosine tRNA methylthiotransferase MtaB
MRVSFKTFGCRLNQAESALYQRLFQSNGINVVPFGEECEICVIHSCSVTRRAESECLRIARRLKHSAPQMLVVLSGCAVESATASRLQELGIDLIIGRAQKNDLVQITLNRLGKPYTEPEGECVPSFSTHRALLKIQDGCDFFCTYCIIPYNRGAPVSRNFQKCLDEARAFIDAGFKEIVVTGCNIGCYRDQQRTLPELLEALAALPGLGRLRCGSIEPGTVELRIAELIAAHPTLTPFLHLPLQHCDDRILDRMHRRYCVAEMRDILEQIINLVPRIALGSDIITGFPGEDDQAFRNTLDFIQEYPFSNLHVFPYSERSGTAAAEFPERVPHNVRRERARALIRIGSLKRREYAAGWIGNRVETVVEKFDRQGRACGWSAQYLACRVADIPPEQRSQIMGKKLQFVPEKLDEDILLGSFNTQLR